VDKIHVEMKQAENNLKNLKKCCGLCVLPWQRIRRPTETYKSSSTTNPNKSPSTVTTTEPKSHAKNDGSTTASNNYIDRITNDDRETEMNNNLDTVGNYVGQLKNMALDMNKTVQGQNIQITNITQKTEYESRRITAADKEAKNILRNA
jgi:synaptosomal-associated protein 25